MSKFHIMHFGKNNRKFKYQLRGSELEASEWEKDVGVIVYCSVQSLGRFRGGSHTETLLRLYKTYVRPHLEYCQAAWAFTVNSFKNNLGCEDFLSTKKAGDRGA